MSSFVDRDMLMRYHWGLGVGHMYAHSTASTGPPSRSTSQQSQPLHSKAHDAEDHKCHDDDEVDEGGDAADNSETEQDFEHDSECSESQSEDLESVLGDLADMHGCGSDLDALYTF